MDLLNQFKDFLFSQKDLPAKVTVKNYLSDVNHFFHWYESHYQKPFAPQLITHGTIEAYKKASLSLDNGSLKLDLEARNSKIENQTSTFQPQVPTSSFQRLSSRSLERHLSSLRKFFKFLKLEGHISLNPFEQFSNSAIQQSVDPYRLRDFKSYLYVYNASHLTIKNYIIDIRQFFTWAEEVLSLSLDNGSSKLEIEAGSSRLDNQSSNLQPQNPASSFQRLSSKEILSAITPSLLEEYKNRLANEGNFSPSTVNRKLSSLRKYLTWAAEEKLLGNSEFRIQNLKLNRTDAGNVRLELESLRSRSQGVNPSVDGSSSNTSNFPPQEFGKPNYSGFPPLRLFQKISKIGIFAFDQLLTLPLAKAFDKVSYMAWLAKGRPVFTEARKSKLEARIPTSIFQLLNPASSFQRRASKVKNLPKEFYAPLEISTRYFPWHKKMWHTLRYKRPKWYEVYHSYPIAHYFNFAILTIFMAVIGFGFYQSFFQKPSTGKPVLAALPSAPIRILSFQGRLTDNFDNPISTPSALRFAIYNSQAPASGSALLWQEVDSVSPDQDGIFSVLLGNAGNCPVGQSNPTGPCGIPPWLFASNSALFLGVSVNTTPEMTPRQQLATVAYAANSETLQGLPPITQAAAGTSNVVLALDSSGNLTIGGSANPTFQASGGQFTISGQPVLITTNTGSNANVTLSADGWGKIDLSKPIVNTSNNNNIASAVGSVEIDDLLSVLATSSGQSALTINQTGGGPLISASQSGTAKFTVDGSGNVTIASGSIYSVGTSQGLSLTNACVNTTGGIVTGTGTCPAGVNWWNQVGGLLSPVDNTYDFAIGGTSTSSAKFSYTGIQTGQTIASVSGNLIVMANNGWGGNVGIGTTNPGGALTIGSGQILIPDGSLTTPFLARSAATQTGLYFKTDNSLWFTVGGTAVWGAASANVLGLSNGVRLGFSSGDISTVAADTYLKRIGVNTLQLSASDNTTLGTLIAGSVGIGTTSPLATLDVRPNTTNGGTIAIASISGKTSFAALVANNDGAGDLFTASKSGLPIFTVRNNGQLTLGAPYYTAGCTALETNAAGTLVCGTDDSGGGVNWWNQLAGALSPVDITNDLLIGSTSTSSALFSFTGVKTGQTIASVSGQLIVMANNGWGGQVGIGTTAPAYPVSISATAPNIANGRILDVDGFLTSTTNDQSGFKISPAVSPTGNTSRTYSGGVFSTSGNSTTRLTNATLRGFDAQASFSGASGILGTAMGGRYLINNTGGGTVTNAYGIMIDAPNNSGILTNTRGIYIATQTNGTQTNNPYAIYQEGATDYNYFAGNVGIGTTAPLTTLDVRGSSGTLAVASISGKTSFAALVANNDGVGDLFTASSSGVNKFAVKRTGELLAPAYATCTLKTDSNGLFTCGTDLQGSGASPFTEVISIGSIIQNNTTEDFLLGGTASTTAKFAFLNMAQARGNQIASFSGSLTLDSATAAIQTTNNRGLTIGGNTTGLISMYSLGLPVFSTPNLNNTLVGIQAGRVVSASSSSVFGFQAGYNLTSGNENTYIGNMAGYTNSTFPRNTYVGNRSGYLTAGNDNTFVGNDSGTFLTGGNYNTAIGASAMRGTLSAFSGTNNTAVGNEAGIGINGSASSNTLMGNFAGGGSNFTGSNNTFLGYEAGVSNTIGIDNTFIGFDAGVGNTTGNYNIRMGYSADANANNVSSSIVIGYVGQATANNQLVIGSNSLNGEIYDAYLGQGVTDAAPTGITLNATGGTGTNITGGGLTLAGGKGTGNAAGGDIIFQTSDQLGSGSTLQSLTTKMIITELGNVGIGTTNPLTTLDIRGTNNIFASISATLVPGLSLKRTDQVGELNLGVAAGAGSFFASGVVAGDSIIRFQGNSSTSLKIGSDPNGGPLVTITNGGAVGIGTTGPVNKLDVNGGVAIGTYAGVNTAPANGLIVSGATAIGTSAVGNYRLNVENGFSHFSYNTATGPTADGNGGLAIGWNKSAGQAETNFYNVFANAGTAFEFLQNTGTTTYSSLMTMLGNGNVGIGTTAPGAKLHIDADGTGTDNIAGLEITSIFQQPLISTNSALARSVMNNTQSGNVFLLTPYARESYLIGSMDWNGSGAFEGISHPTTYITRFGGLYSNWASSTTPAAGSTYMETNSGSNRIKFFASDINPAMTMEYERLFIGPSWTINNGPRALLDVRLQGHSGIIPVASFSGKTSFAALVVDNSGAGDLITASASGVTQFKISNAGRTDTRSFYDLDNPSYFLDPAATATSLTTAGSVGIGVTAPTALLTMNQTGNNDIFLASMSGDLRFKIGNNGNVVINANTSTDDVTKTTTADFTQAGSTASNVTTTTDKISQNLGTAGMTVSAGPSTLGAIGAGAHALQRPDGKFVVVVGRGTNSTNIYNPVENTFTTGPALTAATGSDGAGSIQLPYGKFLTIIGGFSTNTSIYDPATNTFSVGPATVTSNQGGIPFYRPDGKILFMLYGTLGVTNLYDPATNTFSVGPTFTTASNIGGGAFVIQRPDGKFLINTGGGSTTSSIYDGTSNPGAVTAGPTFSTGISGDGPPPIQRPDGTFLIFKGGNSQNTYIYNPFTNQVDSGPTTTSGVEGGGHAFIRPDGKFIVVVGFGTTTTNIYDPVANTFSAGTALSACTSNIRYGGFTLQRPDGKYLTFCGNNSTPTQIVDTGWTTSGSWESEQINLTGKLASGSALFWKSADQNSTNPSRIDPKNITFNVRTAQTANMLVGAAYASMSASGDFIPIASATANFVQVKINFIVPIPGNPSQGVSPIIENNVWAPTRAPATYLKNFAQPTVFEFTIKNPVISKGGTGALANNWAGPLITGAIGSGASGSAQLINLDTDNNNALKLTFNKNAGQVATGSGEVQISTGSAVLTTAAADGALSIQRPDGKFLVVLGGGTSSNIYDPSTNTFSAGPTLAGASVGAGGHAFQRPDGRFVIIFGNGSSNTVIYNPVTNTVTSGPNLPQGASAGAQSIQLPNGKFLTILGGSTRNTALYDPNTNSYSQGPYLTGGTVNAGAFTIPLPTGKFLTFLGGVGAVTNIYDPVSNSFSLGTASLRPIGTGAFAIQRSDGIYLIIIGNGATQTILLDPSSTVYLGTANEFADGNVLPAGAGAGAHAIQLSDGKFLIILGNSTNSTAIYNPYNVASSASPNVGNFTAGPSLVTLGGQTVGAGAHSFQRSDGKYMTILGGTTTAATINVNTLDAGWALTGTYISEPFSESSLGSNTVLNWDRGGNSNGKVTAKVRTATSLNGLGAATWNDVEYSGANINAGTNTFAQIRFDLQGTLPSYTGAQKNVWRGSGEVVPYRTPLSPTLTSFSLTNNPAGNVLVINGENSALFRFTAEGSAYSGPNGAWYSGGADVAEYYPSTQKLKPGELVSADPTNIDDQAYVVKTTKEYQQDIMGIVSTKPGFVAGAYTENGFAVALVGRVPVKVSTINGDIKVGDFLTSSSIEGVAQKATKAGNVVGKALQPFSCSPSDPNEPGSSASASDALPAAGGSTADFGLVQPNISPAVQTICEGTTLAFVNVGYNDPTPAIITAAGGIENFVINQATGSAYFVADTLGNTIDNTGVFASSVIGNLRAGVINTSQLFADVIQTNLINADKIISPIASINEIHTDLISPLANNHIEVAGDINVEGNATISGTIRANQTEISGNLTAGDASISGTLRAGKIIASEIEGLQPSVITNVTNIYNSTQSATSNLPASTSEALQAGQQLATISNEPGSSASTSGYGLVANGYIDISSYSGQLNNVDNLIANTATFNQGLMSFGPSSFSDVSVVGQLSVDGNLILASNSINVLGGDLQIQPLKQGGLSVMAGLFYIDTNGNIKVGGNAEFAKNVSVGGKLSTNIISPIPGNDLAINLASGSANAIHNSEFIIQNSNNSTVATINQSGDLTASGTATFNKLNLGLVSPAFALSNTEVIATGSAGTASIRAYQTQITINNPLVTDKSLIYVTPKSNQVIYLIRQVPGVSFTVGVSTPTYTDIPFNWIIVN